MREPARKLWAMGRVLWLYVGCKLGLHPTGDYFESGLCACQDFAVFRAARRGRDINDLPEWSGRE